MRNGASSSRVASEMATTAYFEAEYTEPPGWVHIPMTEAVLTMWPSPPPFTVSLMIGT